MFVKADLTIPGRKGNILVCVHPASVIHSLLTKFGSALQRF